MPRTRSMGSGYELTCNVCQEVFGIATVNIDQETFLKIKSTEPFGTRWNCPACLESPVTTENMHREIINLKTLMKEEIKKLTQNFDTKFRSFETSISSKLTNKPKVLTKITPGPSYADTLRKNLQVQVNNNLPTTSPTPIMHPQIVQNPILIDTSSTSNTIEPSIRNITEPSIGNTTEPSTSNTTEPSTSRSNTTEIVDADELRKRENKRLNVVLYRVPESSNPNETVAYQEDMLKLKDVLFEREGFKPEHVKRAHRIGQKSGEKVRPIRIIFTDETTRTNVLSMTNLTYKQNSETVKLYTAEDRTRMQLQHYNMLFQELKIRRETGESDLMIRNGSIVQKLPFRPTPQNIWAIPTHSEA